MRCLLPLLLLCTCGPALTAQIETNPEFDRLLDSLDVRFNRPFASDFRTLRRTENDYLADHLAIYSRDEKLELRFHLSPESEADRYYRMPHLAVSTLVMNLGSNDEDAVTAVHRFDEEELAVLNADWARMFTFRPKRSFSGKTQAQLVAAYREGRGLFYTILLFDRAPDTLEGRQMSLRFR